MTRYRKNPLDSEAESLPRPAAQAESAGGRIERIAVEAVTDKAFVEALRRWQEAPDSGTPEGAVRLLTPLCDSATQLRLTPVERGAALEHGREPSADRV